MFARERAAMRGRAGCFGLLAVAGLAGLFPNFCYLIHRSGNPIPPRAPRQPPVCLEAWVRLRSFRGCPVLAAWGGYRLGIYCFPGGCSGPAGSSNGALVFAGPFPGRAYISERPVPLGEWVHLAGIEGSVGPVSAAIPAAVAIGGADVTGGRMAAGAGPLALGYDPWEARSAAAREANAARAALAMGRGRSGARRGQDCGGTPGPPDGEIGAWRWSRAWRSLAQVAAGRGTARALMPLGRSSALPTFPMRAPSGATGRITPRGWVILAAGLLAALAMAGAGLALRHGSKHSRRSRRSRRSRLSRRSESLGLCKRSEAGEP
jgi:hypothetical protein